MFRREFVAYISSIWLTEQKYTVDEQLVLNEAGYLAKYQLRIEAIYTWNGNIDELVTDLRFLRDETYLFSLHLNSRISREFLEQHFPFAKVQQR